MTRSSYQMRCHAAPTWYARKHATFGAPPFVSANRQGTISPHRRRRPHFGSENAIPVLSRFADPRKVAIEADRRAIEHCRMDLRDRAAQHAGAHRELAICGNQLNLHSGAWKKTVSG